MDNMIFDNKKKSEQTRTVTTSAAASAPTKVYLQMDHHDDDDSLDLLNVAKYMGKRKRYYLFFTLFMACIGVFIGIIVNIGKFVFTDTSYATAVINFNYQGIEDGLDPNGAAFDVNKIKSPNVINDALDAINMTKVSTEDVRQNIEIEGVIPEDAVQRITVINNMAAEDPTMYEKILDVEYFPSQYIVKLKNPLFDMGLSTGETTELLNAVLDSYHTYFMDNYANTQALSVTFNMINYSDYDYTEAMDMIDTQITSMKAYVDALKAENPDFRATSTGLSFGDISSSLDMIDSIQVSKLVSYIDSNTLTKDVKNQKDYLTYRIQQLNLKLSELQTQMTTTENTIANYQKDPVIIVSSQESTEETTQTDEYYQKIVANKLSLSQQIATVNSDLNESYTRLNNLNNQTASASQDQYDTADESLQSLVATLSSWVDLIEKTAAEYYDTTKFSTAYKIAVPAQYASVGGIVDICIVIAACVALMVFIALFRWICFGLKQEMLHVKIQQAKRKE